MLNRRQAWQTGPVRRLINASSACFSVGTPFALGWIHATYRARDYRFGQQNSLWAYLLFGLVLLALASILGIPDEARDWQPAVASAALASLLSLGTMALVALVFPNLLPRFVLITAPIVVFALNVVVSRLSFHARRHGVRRDRVLAIVDANEATFLRTAAEASDPRPEAEFQLVGIEAVPHLPDSNWLERTVEQTGATLLVLSDDLRTEEGLLVQAARLHAAGTRVRSLDAFSDEWLGKLPISALSRMALMTDNGHVHGGVYPHLKRLLDLLAGLVLAVATIVAAPIVLLGNLLGNRGPLLFFQDRIGRDGEPFTIVKFRTMRPEADNDGSWTQLDDPRITRFGRILRHAHVDEFPQFLNIVRGELSIVGPRPEQPRYVDELRTKLPFYDLRHIVAPGLTGWAQVKFRYGGTEADALEKLEYDLFYLRHQSLSLDLRILSRSLRSIVRRKGR
jgi:lipopolysaccharide/colanic/teichoic acid biosynthesis glycosyltransferase